MIAGMRRKFNRRRPINKRRFYRRKSPQLLNQRFNKVFATRRWCIQQTLTGADATPASTGTNVFTLSSLPNYTDFTNLFDMYQIAGIKYRFVVKGDPSVLPTTVANDGKWPRFVHVIDRNDQISPANFDELRSYQNCKEVWLTGNNPASRWYYFKPATLTVGYTSAVTSNYSTDYKRWISTGDAGATYYGLKYAFEGLYTGLNVDIECVYYVRLKAVR